ncbi:MAG: type II toxin-antitoxin system Phd/YefM family antitoxin [bacterium]|nr:type II toxin-antitoxin system Phd/YefM family antitoxin [bacterium]
MDILGIPFVGTYELRKNLPLLLAQIQRKGDGVVVTQKGKPAAMLLSIKRYLEMKGLVEELEEAIKELADKDYMAELLVDEKEIRVGKGKTAEEVFKKLGI